MSPTGSVTVVSVFGFWSDSALGRRIAVWQSDRYWIYEVWIAGRCVVIGCAATRELALRLAELA